MADNLNQAKHIARVCVSGCRTRRHKHDFWFAFNAAQSAHARLCTCNSAGGAGSTGPVRMTIVQHLVNVSGGKDSTAVYLRAIEVGRPFRAVFADAGNGDQRA